MSLTLAALLLKAGVAPVVHEVATTVAVQVGPTRFTNSSHALVRQTLLSKSATDYLVGVDIVEATQQATDLFSRVTADINQLSRQLVLRADTQGRLTEVANRPDLLQQWVRLRPALAQKYADQPSVAPFLEAFEQQLALPGTLELSIVNKGLYGALFPGLYGQALSATNGVESQRELLNFFNQLPLPLLLTTVASPAPADMPGAAIQLTTTGRLDESRFDKRAFERMMRDIVDDVSFAVALAIIHSETYVVDLASGWILSGFQTLTAEVPGAYYQQTTHTITPVVLGN